MSTKRVDLNLKKKSCAEAFAVKEASGGVFIEGFANKATIDRGDEIITTDAWELDNFKRNPIILFNHGMDSLGGTPVGKATEIKQTDQGLFLKVKLSNSQAPGIKMVRDLVEERILKAFSVGFNPKQSDMIQIDGKDVRQISKAELFEVSIVGVPMNQDSLFDLSAKSLSTKSFHQLKGDILKAKGAAVALEIEGQLGACPSRKDAMAMVAKIHDIEMTELLDMLAGDSEIPAEVAATFKMAIKAVDLQQTLREALSALADGADEAAVTTNLLAKLSPDQEDPVEEADPGEEADPSKTDAGKEGQTPIEKEAADAAAASAAKEKEDADAAGKDAERKADFQKCVNETLPGLLADGMAQDEATAAAIAKCQESGKCQLTPESKVQVFKLYTDHIASANAVDLLTVDSLPVLAFKEVTEQTQSEQTPTVAIQTDKGESDFGSPQLEATKQTNVLLGALINEIQKLSNKLDGISQQSSVPSSDVTPAKDQGNSSEADLNKSAAEEDAKKRLDSLNVRLKSLGF
jgi:HK97 family phage prohead protease